MSIRRLGPGDEVVAREAVSLFGGTGPLDTARFLRTANACLYVADDDAGLVGWVYGHELVHPDGERTMLLYSLDVADHARRRGHGRALVTAFVEHARVRGCTEVWVLTDDGNVAAEATYRSAGGVRATAGQVMFAWPLAPGTESSV